MKDLLEYLAKALVDNPDDVHIEVIEGERSVILQLKVNPEEWRAELPLIEEWFEFIGEKLPTGVADEFEALKQRLAEAD